MLTKGTCLRFYKRKDVQEALVRHAQGKEIGIRFGDGFGKRPDTLTYPRDVLELALRGATSFHASEEIWHNPLQLSADLPKKELEQLRQGWDLVLDIDCAILEYSKICADLILSFLRYCGVEDLSVKFSGNKGFHIGVPFHAFPQHVGNVPTRLLFPEAARKIAHYIKENIKEELGRRLLEYEHHDINAVAQKVQQTQEEIIRYEQNKLGDRVAKLHVDPFLEIDTVLISSRHLYRMPYSLHEKSGLVSLPLDPAKILSFEKTWAHPDTFELTSRSFLSPLAGTENARRLLLQALDFEIKKEQSTSATPQKYEEFHIESPITAEFFPPCIKTILQGMEDGKKRGLFCLLNYLGKIGWSKPEIEQYLAEWNQRNPQPLREVYIKGQLAHFQPGERLPPNCDNEAYYKALGIKCPHEKICARVKNPVNYTLLQWRRHRRMLEEQAEAKPVKSKSKSKAAGSAASSENSVSDSGAAMAPQPLKSPPDSLPQDADS